MVLVSLVAALVLTGIDQGIKLLVALHVPYQPYGETPITVIPGVFGISHTHNTGAAWSILSNSTWLLTALSVIASVAVLYLLLRKKLPHPMGRWSLVLILAGALGNLIDRIRLGYVIDMFRFLFVSFPVFNFADVCITVGGILLCVYIVFFYGKGQKGSGHGDHLPTT